MNEKEIGELRRRLRPDRHNIRQVCGCYVSEKGEIISTFAQSLNLMPEDEMEKYMSGNTDSCHYFTLYDEYKVVRKQN